MCRCHTDTLGAVVSDDGRGLGFEQVRRGRAVEHPADNANADYNSRGNEKTSTVKKTGAKSHYIVDQRQGPPA